MVNGMENDVQFKKEMEEIINLAILFTEEEEGYGIF